MPDQQPYYLIFSQVMLFGVRIDPGLGFTYFGKLKIIFHVVDFHKMDFCGGQPRFYLVVDLVSLTCLRRRKAGFSTVCLAETFVKSHGDRCLIPILHRPCLANENEPRTGRWKVTVQGFEWICPCAC